VIYKKLEWLTREDLIKHFISDEFNRFLAYYKNAPDLNVTQQRERQSDRGRDRGERGERGERNDSRESRSKSYSRFYINLGAKDGIDPLGMIGLINKYNKGYRVEIGKIDILRKFSFFEVESSSEKEILNSFENANYKGISLAVQISVPDTKARNRHEDRPINKPKRNRERTN
jgi:ATP-dependent RNA helicase DeaD